MLHKLTTAAQMRSAALRVREALEAAAQAAAEAVEELAAAKADASAVVPNTRTINGKALSGDVVLNAADVGAADAQYVDRAVQAAVTGAMEGEY